jgi:hypothetical protein
LLASSSKLASVPKEGRFKLAKNGTEMDKDRMKREKRYHSFGYRLRNFLA